MWNFKRQNFRFLQERSSELECDDSREISWRDKPQNADWMEEVGQRIKKQGHRGAQRLESLPFS